MEMIFDELLYVCIIAGIFAPAAIACWFFEDTRIGRRIWDTVLVPWLIKHDILPDDYWDREE